MKYQEMRFKKLVPTLLWLVFVLPVWVLHAQTNLTLKAMATPVTELSVGDIDFQNFGSHTLFFSLSIESNTARSVRLISSLDILLADGSSFPGAATLRTKPFNVTARPDRKVLSNLDIGPNTTIKTEKFEFSTEAKDRIREIALATGKLPSGTYTFTLRVEDASNPSIAYEDHFVFNLQTISRLDLISPPDESQLSNQSPQFNWRYDGDRVELSIYEWLSSQHSREEAAEGNPHLIVRSGEPELPIGARSFQYPTAGVRQLEPGKTYVWRVKGLTLGSGGVGSTINSDIWQFSIAAQGGTVSSGEQEDLNNLSNQIQNLGGVNQQLLNDIFSGDVQLTGVIMIDGHPVSAAEALRLLKDLLANPDRIITMQYID